MPFTPVVWIEVRRRFREGEKEDSDWRSVFSATPLIEWYAERLGFDLYSALFDVRPQSLSEYTPQGLSTGRRGLPKDLNPVLRIEVLRGDYSLREDLTGTETINGRDHTWLSWQDVLPYADENHNKGWRSTIEVMRTLTDIYGEEDVRMIFWMEK